MKKYKLWAILLRAIVMGLPALLSMMFEWLFDKSESFLLWLDSKLPDPRK